MTLARQEKVWRERRLLLGCDCPKGGSVLCQCSVDPATKISVLCSTHCLESTGPNLWRFSRALLWLYISGTPLCFCIDDRLYIVMELIEGAPLGEHFSSLKEKQHHFSEERLWKIFIQVHSTHHWNFHDTTKFWDAVEMHCWLHIQQESNSLPFLFQAVLSSSVPTQGEEDCSQRSHAKQHYVGR